MGVGSLSERLAFVLSLDADGAIRGFKKVGDTADKELGRADNRLNRVGGTMQKVGVGAIAFAGVAGVGLFKMAQASEEANLSSVRLANSIKNNPKLAGESTKAFEDLASAIMKKTAADDDAIVAGMAMLGTFKVTGDQIRGLTPLVVDYARKFGVDMVSANAQVGKALDGSVGALKRNGVSIDENLFKTDRYAAVMQALRTQVGGFAEEEGATFAGRLERLQNELGNLAEGVGAGVVRAFERFANVADSTFGALDRLGVGTQSTAGEFATYGVAVLGAAGAASFLIGSVIKMRENFKKAAEGLSNFTAGIGGAKGAMKGLGVAAGTIGVIVGGAQLLNEAFDNNNAERWAKSIQDASGKATNQLVADFQKMEHAAARSVLPFAQEVPKKFFEQLVDGGTQGIATAQRLADALKAAGEDTSQWQAMIDGATASQKQMNADQETGTGIIEDNTDAVEGNTTATKVANTALDGRIERLRVAADKQKAMTEATWGAFNSDLSYRDAVDAAEDALAELVTKTEEAATATGDKLAPATEALDDQLRTTEGALLTQAEAAAALAEKNAIAAGKIWDENAANAAKREELVKVAEALGPGHPLYQRIIAYIEALDRVPRQIHTSFTTSGDAAPTVGGSGNRRARAHGGPVSPHEAYVVGEEGPELLVMGSQGGKVIPNGGQAAAIGGGGNTYHITVNVAPGANPIDTGRQLVELIRTYERGGGGTGWRN